MQITSASNQIVKEIKKLKKDRSFLFLDNPKLILEAVESGRKLEFVIVESGKENRFNKIVGETNLVVSSGVFKTLSSAEQSQGVLALVKNEAKKFKPPCGNFLVLDEVQDPGNVGTLLRSALAFGFNDVYLINCASLANEKVVRSTMGAIFKLNAIEISREEFVKKFEGKNLVAGQMNGANILNEKIALPVGVVVGNEGNGVSNEIKKISKGVSIEMEKCVESLNASVAGSILMFEIKKEEKIYERTQQMAQY